MWPDLLQVLCLSPSSVSSSPLGVKGLLCHAEPWKCRLFERTIILKPWGLSKRQGFFLWKCSSAFLHSLKNCLLLEFPGVLLLFMKIQSSLYPWDCSDLSENHLHCPWISEGFWWCWIPCPWWLSINPILEVVIFPWLQVPLSGICVCVCREHLSLYCASPEEPKLGAVSEI